MHIISLHILVNWDAGTRARHRRTASLPVPAREEPCYCTAANRQNRTGAFPLMATDIVRIGRALLSVSDKTGLLDLARALEPFGVDFLSTGGTAAALNAAGFAVVDVAQMTGFPEMMDGRVKTLHPRVHGGLLAIRSDPAHQAAMIVNGIAPIDLLVVNLYPFEETLKRGAPFEDRVENIDIGGPTMIRSAAKNHDDVVVIVDVDDYPALVDELQRGQGATSLAFRRRMAQKAFARTA